MKTRLLFLFFLSSLSYAQIPTNGLIASYELDNGTFVDGTANMNDFTKTGVSSSNTSNRFNVVNNALSCNGDYLTRSDINFGNTSGSFQSVNQVINYSFWIKTSTNDSNRRTIIDQSERSGTGFNGNETGYFIYLKNGKIGASSRVRYNSNQLNQAVQANIGHTFESTTTIADSNWHHVNVSIELTFVNNTSNFARYELKNTITIDNNPTQQNPTTFVAAFGVTKTTHSLGNVNIANNRISNLSGVDIYQDELDDIHVYDRALTTAEINTLFSNGNFCAVPDVSILGDTAVTTNSATINISQTGTFDLAYLPEGEPFTNAQIISNITNGVVPLSGLTSLTTYNVFVREKCANTTEWSVVPYSFTTPGIVYVNENATGANTGLNWGDAFTSLTDALAFAPSKSEIWIATGTYKPNSGDRENTFAVVNDDVKIYGGFTGSETSINQRNFYNNITVLSGDINGNDTGVDFVGNGRGENVYHVITISGERVIVDGIVVSGGQSDASSGDNRFGGGIRKQDNVLELTIRNSIFENNVAVGAGGIYAKFIAGGQLLVENSIFRNNVVTYAGGVYTINSTSGAYTVNLSNSLFHNNITKDRSGTALGFTGSGAWLRANTTSSSLVSTVTNCTFVNNTDIGTQPSAERGVLGLSRGGNCSHNFTGVNNIFYHNQDANGDAVRTLNQGHSNFATTLNVRNSIAQDGFSKVNASSQTNTSSSNPLFSDYLNNDFTLQGSSPARDSGDNAYVTLTEDLAGNPRIVNTTVDMGVYEKVLVCGEISNIQSTENTLVADETTITWNHAFNNSGPYDLSYTLVGEPIASGTTITNITNEIYTLSGLTLNTFYDIYIRTYCNGIPTAYVKKTIGFKTPIFVNSTATGNNDGSSWVDAYTSLQTALSVAQDDEEIWLASGVYKPHASNRDVSFNITQQNLKIYGGFAGTELQLSQRLYGANETILSGDLANNDVNLASYVDNYSNTTRNTDNSYHIVTISATGNNLLLDGLTIKDAHNNKSATERGGAIVKDKTVADLTLNNCIVKDNVSRNDNAGLVCEYELNNTSGARGNLIITNSRFSNNMSRWASGIYSFVRGNTNVDIVVENCLFSKNIAANLNNTGATGLSGSASWFRIIANGSNVTLKINNNTYVDNLDTGTNQNLSNNTRAPLAISRNTQITSPMTAEVSNCIFWNNKGASNANVRAISDLYLVPILSLDVYNSLDALNFVEGSITSSVNTVTSNPMFNDAINGDYTLSPTSPALNAGDNTYTTQPIDLLNNSRISGGVIDMGAYELPVNCGDISNITLEKIPSVTNSATLSWQHPFNNSGPFDLVYVESGEPIANGTVVNNITTNTYTITNILPESAYDYYIRTNCSGSPTTYEMVTITLSPPVYVNLNATGLNDGTSWVNAYTDLQTALSSVQGGESIWIAAGTYYPTSTGDRNARFLINKNDISLKGGFAGNEIKTTDRIFGANETILSGDLNNNDANTLDFISNYSNTTRNGDNSYHVVFIGFDGENALLERLTISGAHNNLNASEQGGAIVKFKTVNKLDIKDCIIENNVSRNACAAVFAEFDLNNTAGIRGGLNIENCVIKNNMSRWGTGVYTYARDNTNIDVNIVNNLFQRNIAGDLNTSTARGLSGSAAWVRMLGNTADLNLKVINNTFVNNIDEGTNNSLNNATRATFAISANSGLTGTLNTDVANSIFWGNTTVGGNITKSISPLYLLAGNSLEVFNSIDQAGFNDASITNTTNTSSLDPLFNSVITGDYSLSSSSPGLNSGDNSFVTTITDLSNNSRIINTTVDMGAYEFLGSISLMPKAFLQGAMLGSGASIMRDDLRANNYIPTTSPYVDAATCNSSVFAVTGNDAIVDWVLIELRDATTNTTIIASQSALIQRDGDVVAVDGVSPVIFNVPNGSYFVVVKHRNHLGIMTANTVSLNQTTTIVDFTNANAPITFGTDAQATFGMPSGLAGMWAGDTGRDGRLNYLGGQSDVPAIRAQVFNDPANSIFGGPPVATYGSLGYYDTDINMDGATYYSGASSDVLSIRNNIFNNPSNSVFGGPPVATYIFTQQLPEGAN